MATVELVRFDLTGIEQLQTDLLLIDQQAIGRVAQRTANQVAALAFDESRRRITAGLNLDDAYVRDRMYVEEVNTADVIAPTAYVIAPTPSRGAERRTRGNPIATLRRYGPAQLTQPVRYSNAALASKFGKLGPNPRKAGSLLPFKPRIGDSTRGIPVGQKQAGVSVEVTRGQRKKISYAFLMPMRAGKIDGLGGLGVFVREKGDPKKKVRALLGPSVYQVFRTNLESLATFAQKKLVEVGSQAIRDAVAERLIK